MKLKYLFGRKTQPLPTNIESATREYIQDNLGAWDQEILQRRAARLGVTVEEASEVEPKPLYLIEAEKRAEAEGRTLESVLEEHSERLKRSTYPGPECFFPDEVVDYAEGGLLEERLKHADSCSACATLLAASKPLDAARKALLAGMAAPVGGGGVLVDTLSSRHSNLSETKQTLKAWIEKVLPAAAVPAFMYLIFSVVDRSATQLTFLHNRIPWIVTILMVAASMLIFRARVPVLARRIGIGACVGAVVASFLFVDFRQSQSNRDLALTYAQERLVSVCADSIRNYQKTGNFLETNRTTGMFRLATTQLSDTQATYIMTAKELPGRVVCDLGANGGDLKWEYGKKVVDRVDLLTGTLQNTSEGMVVEFADGKKVNVHGSDNQQDLTPGTHVLAAVEPTTRAVRSVHAISEVLAAQPVPQTAAPERFKPTAVKQPL